MGTLSAFVVLVALGLVTGEEGARLLASKSLLNRYAVESRDLTLQYNIYNVGTRSAASASFLTVDLTHIILYSIKVL